MKFVSPKIQKNLVRLRHHSVNERVQIIRDLFQHPLLCRTSFEDAHRFLEQGKVTPYMV